MSELSAAEPVAAQASDDASAKSLFDTLAAFEDIIGPLERTGDAMTGYCPFHNKEAMPNLLMREDAEQDEIFFDCRYGCGEDEIVREMGERVKKQHLLESATFRLLPDYAIAELPAPEFLVDGILPAGALSELHGHPGTGKTFVALSMAMSIATGRSWFGRSVKAGPVVYVAAEGKSGLSSRVEAWKRQHSVRGTTDIYFPDRTPMLMLDYEARDLIEAISEMPEAPVLVVFDTLARVMVSGDENSSKDMSTLVQNADRIREETGAAVLFVHHSLKNGDTERGSSVLRGALDAMIWLRTKGEQIELRCEKMKDAADFEPISLGLLEAHGSCVVIDGATAKLHRLSDVSVKERAALEALAVVKVSGATEWRERTGLPERTFYNVVRSLSGKRLVERQQGGKRSPWTLTAEGNDWIAANCQEPADARTAVNDSKLPAVVPPLGAQKGSEWESDYSASASEALAA